MFVNKILQKFQQVSCYQFICQTIHLSAMHDLRHFGEKRCIIEERSQNYIFGYAAAAAFRCMTVKDYSSHECF